MLDGYLSESATDLVREIQSSVFIEDSDESVLCCKKSLRVTLLVSDLRLSKSDIASRSGMEAPVLEEQGDVANLNRVAVVGLVNLEGEDLDDPAESEPDLGEDCLAESFDDDRDTGDVLNRGENDRLDDALDEGKNVGVLRVGVLRDGVLSVGEVLERPRAASCHWKTGTDFSEGELN